MKSEITKMPDTVGMQFQPDLPFEEWQKIGERFGEATKRFSWALGDWMVYGQKGYKGRVPAEVYDQAHKATGIDKQSLLSLATVCKRIPIEKRIEGLSFEHHQAVSTINNPELRFSWIEFLKKQEREPSKKILRLSISCFPDKPGIITKEEYLSRHTKSRKDNYQVHLSRLMAILRKTLPLMDEDQKEAVKADLEPLAVFIDAL